MPDVILIDRFTRQNQSVSGRFAPQDLPRLAEYLAGSEGEIVYSISGSRSTDLTGSQKRCVKCIISGWFLLADPVTSEPVRHECEIESKLIVVAAESELPPLEMESDDEDYVVVGAELNVLERIEEEVLLDLPAAYAGKGAQVGPAGKVARVPKVSTPAAKPGKISPFAKLAELKKK